MDELIIGTRREREEYVAKLLRRRQMYAEEMRRIDATLEAIEGIYNERQADVPDDYDVIEDIAPLVRESPHPLKQSEIFAQLKGSVMERFKCSEDQARSNIYRALWYHTTKGPGSNFDRGVRAVAQGPEGYKSTAFKTKANRSHYPDNLIWHSSKLTSSSRQD